MAKEWPGAGVQDGYIAMWIRKLSIKDISLDFFDFSVFVNESSFYTYKLCL